MTLFYLPSWTIGVKKKFKICFTYAQCQIYLSINSQTVIETICSSLMKIK